eukprot:2550790-Heterocapsa_arctica.AAC.1
MALPGKLFSHRAAAEACQLSSVVAQEPPRVPRGQYGCRLHLWSPKLLEERAQSAVFQKMLPAGHLWRRVRVDRPPQAGPGGESPEGAVSLKFPLQDLARLDPGGA